MENRQRQNERLEGGDQDVGKETEKRAKRQRPSWMVVQHAGRSSKMRFDEFMPIVGVMKSVWTRKEFLPDEFAVKTWYGFLKDLPAEHVRMAVEKLAMTKENYPPTIAEIRRTIVDAQTEDNTWADGWESVQNAVRRYGYMNEQEALASMDEITRKSVKCLGWKAICCSNTDEQTAFRANFRMIYTGIQNKEKDIAKLSADMRNAICNIRTELLY